MFSVQLLAGPFPVTDPDGQCAIAAEGGMAVGPDPGGPGPAPGKNMYKKWT